MNNLLDVVAIGNAIVDLLCFVDNDFLAVNGLKKGTMQQITEQESTRLLSLVTPSFCCAGGSAANSIAGIASLGGQSAFIGCVNNDDFGQIFIKSICENGIRFATPPIENGPKTGVCIVFITPDAERTMATYLGASIELGVDNISSEIVANSKITYLEGYLFDPPTAQEANIKAAKIAKEAGQIVAMGLCDVICIERHRSTFVDFIKHNVDILIANNIEALSFMETQDLDVAISELSKLADHVVITTGSEGSLIVTDKEVHQIDPLNVENIIDTTGAGDLYAGGFLYGISQGFDPIIAGKIATLAASEVITHSGARPQTVLQHLVDQGSHTKISSRKLS